MSENKNLAITNTHLDRGTASPAWVDLTHTLTELFIRGCNNCPSDRDQEILISTLDASIHPAYSHAFVDIMGDLAAL